MPFDITRAILLEIDPQNDFCPAYTDKMGKQTPPGALAVASGDRAIPPLNALANAITRNGGRVAASQDWHPAEHASFASNHKGKKPGDTIELENGAEQVLWPEHCIQGSWGSQFHEKLDLNPVSMIIRKGFRRGLDSYSAFFENDKKTSTGLEYWLRGLGINRIIIGGLATDYCVLYSVMDALNLNWTVIVVSDAVFGVNNPEGSTGKAIDAMKKQGALFLSSEEILHEMNRSASGAGET